MGWIPGIERLAEEGPPVRLALSLHAPDDALRSELMPVNDALSAARRAGRLPRWHERRQRKVFVEYLMLDGVNDRYEQALALADAAGAAARLQGQPVHRHQGRALATSTGDLKRTAMCRDAVSQAGQAGPHPGRRAADAVVAHQQHQDSVIVASCEA